MRVALTKIAEGLAKLEKFRGVQRCLVCHVSSIREAQKQGQDIALRAPMNRAIGPLISTLMVIYHLQQIHRVLTEVQDLTE